MINYARVNKTIFQMQQNDWFNSLTRKFSRNARWKQKKQTFHLFVFVGLNILLHYFDKITFFLSLGEFLEGEISGKSVFPSQRSTWSESKFVLDEKKSLFVLSLSLTLSCSLTHTHTLSLMLSHSLCQKSL